MRRLLSTTKIVVIALILTFSNPGMTSCFAEENSQSNLRIITEEFAPFNFSKAGVVTGQSTDVVKAIMKHLGLDIEIQIMPWSDGYEFTLANADVALYSTSRTQERENLFQWLGPIGSDEYIFYALKDSDLKLESLEEAKKIGTIAVVKHDARQQFLQKNGLTNLLLFDDDTACYKALKDGKVNLVVGSKITMPQMAKSAGIEPAMLNAVYSLQKTPFYIAFSKNTSPQMVKNWQDALDTIKGNGKYDAILTKWNGGENIAKSNVIDKGIISIEASLDLLSRFIDVRLGSFLEVLQAFAVTNDVYSGQWEKIKPLLVEREKLAPEGRIWYLLPDGSYYTTVDDLTSKNLKSRSYFPELIAGNPVLGDVVVSKSTGRTVVIAAAPIVKENQVKGALGTSIYLQDINDDLGKAFPLSAGYIYFAVDTLGIISLHSDGSLIGQELTSLSNELQQIIETYSGKCSFDYAGKSWQANWTTANATNWKIVIASVVH
ncbi:MAG: transporter substrate-binding domain-containing protein [Candidatus Cloacimonadales bacterium]|nr:transporter substrate-binding domain-containing protein [Candidatus Cloacimonadales bacterium]